eukprot:99566-Chlamydomonas_euryale.AAC.2
MIRSRQARPRHTRRPPPIGSAPTTRHDSWRTRPPRMPSRQTLLARRSGRRRCWRCRSCQCCLCRSCAPWRWRWRQRQLRLLAAL